MKTNKIELESQCCSLRLTNQEGLQIDELGLKLTTHANEVVFVILKVPQLLHALSTKIDNAVK